MKSPLRARPCPALRWIWGVLLLPVVAAAAGAPREIVYKRVGDAALKLHVFGEAGASGPRRPGIVFFFAGGWKTGSPEQFFKQCEHLAARGMIAVSAEYRIASVHQTSPREAVQDAKSAVRYLRRHADALGLDPARLAVGGGSSGGHLAAACAFLAGFNEPGEPLEPSCRPDALVLFNPVIDTGPGEKGGYGHSRVQGYSDEISPQEHVVPGLPPTLFMIGSKDRLIPLTTALRFQKAMEEHGNRCDLFIYSGADHGFFQFKKRERGYYDQTVAAMDAFLVSLGFLSPP